ncbi:MAG: hypothetical protein R3F65_06200 [bacterium]|nr:hypothetical protein [Myxococcales bacterium]
MPRLLRLLPLAALLLLAATAAHAKNPADVFKGKIVMSERPFPARFSSDARFISHMKSVDDKSYTYADDAESINIEFMAFFAKAYGGTNFPATIYDVTEGRRQVESFPIYPDPNQKSTRILASNARLTKDKFPDEDRRYELVVVSGGRVIAKTEFTIRESAPARQKRLADEAALKKASVVSFE